MARWMLVGFVHGVLNTDNMTISGEAIDYGPCAFLDAFDPATVYSSIDTGGRYAYANQPVAAEWNLARLAEAMLPLFDTDQDRALARAVDSLDAFHRLYSDAWSIGMRAKLGLTGGAGGGVDGGAGGGVDGGAGGGVDDSVAAPLVEELLGLLHRDRVGPHIIVPRPQPGSGR